MGETTGWQPISTAPKDENPVIIAEYMGTPEFGYRWVICEAYRDSPRRKRDAYLRTGSTRDDEWFDVFNPSHWMPLPEPPTT